MEKDNRQNPADFFSVGQALVLNGIDQHPNPENHQEQSQWQQNKCKDHRQRTRQYCCKHICLRSILVPFLSPSPSSAPELAPKVSQTLPPSNFPALAATGR